MPSFLLISSASSGISSVKNTLRLWVVREVAIMLLRSLRLVTLIHVGQHTVLGEGTLAATMSVKRPAIAMLMLDDEAETASTCSVLPAAAGGRICIYGGENSSDLDPITATAFVSLARVTRDAIDTRSYCKLHVCLNCVVGIVARSESKLRAVSTAGTCGIRRHGKQLRMRARTAHSC